MLAPRLTRMFAYIFLSSLLGTVVSAAPSSPKQQFQALYDKINGALSQGDLRTAAILMGNVDQLKVTDTNATQAQLDAYLANQQALFKKYSTVKYIGVVEAITVKKNVAVVTILESSNGTVIDPKTGKKQVIKTHETTQNTWVKTAGQWKLLHGNI